MAGNALCQFFDLCRRPDARHHLRDRYNQPCDAICLLGQWRQCGIANFLSDPGKSRQLIINPEILLYLFWKMAQHKI